MGWTGDPLADSNRYDRERERRASRYPLCKYCGERIMGDFVFVFDGGTCMCEDCLNEEHRHYVDDYIED